MFVDDSLDAERDLGRAEGRREERDRLRPLLERCEAILRICLVHESRMDELAAVRADLRRELGKEG